VQSCREKEPAQADENPAPTVWSPPLRGFNPATNFKRDA
jgi:hypothetical protein